MLYRSKAPLRLGLAGGGTDVKPYSDIYGGAILNATISLSAKTTIETIDGNETHFISIDQHQADTVIANEPCLITPDATCILAKGVYNYLLQQYGALPGAFKLTTYVEAPAGSGLGTSSTLVVSILGAFVEWLKLPLGEYDIAKMAYHIERVELGMAGGKQDQYAATFGGVNFMEFSGDEKVIVNPLRIPPTYMDELEHNLILYYTSQSRKSAEIIERQSENVLNKNSTSIEAMHHLKEQAIMMKEALLQGRIDEIGEILDFGFQHKKNMANGISNPLIEEVYDAAKSAGATGGKISGAGGGGFMIFYCPKTTRFNVEKVLKQFSGTISPYRFVKHGLVTWRI